MANAKLVNEFLRASKSDKNLSPLTLRAYEIDLNQFTTFLNTKDFQNASRDDIRDYMDHLEELGLKDSTRKRKLATLKVFFGFLEVEMTISVSPLRRFRQRFRTAQRLPKVMSIEEITALLLLARQAGAAANPKGGYPKFQRLRDYAILEILFATGIRIDEAVRLNTYDLNIERKTVLIRGKGRRERLLFISCEEVLDTLSDYLQIREQQCPLSSALFLNRSRHRLTAHSIRTMFNQYCHQAKLVRRYTPHCLRHTMATMLIENGADLRSVQEILGHASVSTTEIYVHVSTRRKREVFQTFNQRDQLSLACVR